MVSSICKRALVYFVIGRIIYFFILNEVGKELIGQFESFVVHISLKVFVFFFAIANIHFSKVVLLIFILEYHIGFIGIISNVLLEFLDSTKVAFPCFRFNIVVNLKYYFSHDINIKSKNVN